MLRDDLLLRTRLTPPRPHRRILPRPQLTARLREALDARLTVVQAGTGYGKTTALAALRDNAAHLFWLTLDESDLDPQQFLTYLVAAFRLRLPELPEAPLALLGELSNGGAVQPAQVIDALLNALALRIDAPALLVLDDYHIVSGSPEISALVERLLAFLPPDLHAVISTRHPPTFGLLPTWRARGETLEIGRADLAFRLDEAAELFRETYGMNLAPDELLLLYDKTEGWPIALQLAGQGLRSGAAQSVFDLLAGGVRSSATLFEYLARELLDRQPPEIAAFLRDTASLRELTPGACDAARGQALGDSSAVLKELRSLDLFVVSLGDDAAPEERYRYHHLFHDFLLAQWAGDAAGLRERHRRAARYFQGRGDGDEAISHWLAAHAYEEAADAIEAIGEDALRAGRLNRLADWIDALPPHALAARPRLQALLGDIYRLRNLYDRALAWYAQAEKTWRVRDDAAGISRALRGQAAVYLDTVRPAQADSLLQEALRLSDGTPDREARARLLDLMAENKLNLGKPVEAETLRREAEMLRNEAPADDTLSARVKLRTGKLGQARQALIALAEAEGRAAKAAPEGHAGPPRGHRETVLLLSLVEAFMGQGERSYALAREGIALGERLESPFITAVGHMRLGHALQVSAATGERINPAPLPPPLRRAGRAAYSEAISWYRSAVALGDRIAVRRTRTEAMWGMTRAYGYSGDLQRAAQCAAEGIETALEAGDIWLVGLANLALGASTVLAGQSEVALESLTAALSAFRNCNDTFGRAATRLWMSLAYLDLARDETNGRGASAGAMSHFLTSADALLGLCEANGYDFLFTGPSLLGPPDERRLVPLLIEARGRQVHPAYAQRLLGLMGMGEIKAHPGYRLTVQALGAFRVWRGGDEIAGREWQRDKARQLFQLLLAERGANLSGRWLQRDQIVERLWPQLAPEAAVRDFKVALNALNKALEPVSSASSRAFFFVEREGTAYRLRPEADIWFDAAEFEAVCERGLRGAASGAGSADDDALAALRAALDLYGGDYLPDALYDDWAAEQRERLLTLYLRAADRLAEALVERGETAEALDLCGAIVARDSCWEHAYQLMMQAYAQQGNRAHALRVYARCVEVLRTELDAPPSADTTRLYRQLSD
jgi:LuxR family transcriptional regulator, maltose regulon positive regulatory protein